MWAGLEKQPKRQSQKGPPGELKGGERRGRRRRGNGAACAGTCTCAASDGKTPAEATVPAMTHEYASPPGRSRLSRVHRLRGARARPASASLRSRALKGVQPGPLWHGDGQWHDPIAGNCSAYENTAAGNLVVARESQREDAVAAAPLSPSYKYMCAIVASRPPSLVLETAQAIGLGLFASSFSFPFGFPSSSLPA